MTPGMSPGVGVVRTDPTFSSRTGVRGHSDPMRGVVAQRHLGCHAVLGNRDETGRARTVGIVRALLH